MENRRDFLKKLTVLAGATGVATGIPPAIQRALAIPPIPGSTFLDAEHIVILMQENRSFDHALGTLKGVRGFNDPRYVSLPNGNPVWFQSDRKGNTYAPFRLNLRDTKATWMGAVPHSRASQVDAFNDGRHDNWIEAKKRGGTLGDIPLTMGYYNRADIPFNYALAEAFTVCDQNFCSGMTSTWPNRFFFWTGTIREEQTPNSKWWIRNDLGLGQGRWKTFPERLEDAGVSWRIYQNDVTCGGGFVGDERSWLANFGCNPLERFERYHVQFTSRYLTGFRRQLHELPEEINELRKQLAKLQPGDDAHSKAQKALENKTDALAKAQQEVRLWAAENFDKLNETEKNLFQKAFTTNQEDPDFHSLDVLTYTDEAGNKRELTVPKGDILHAFRKDVAAGTLPTVSWMVPAEKYSDHPTAPWYGSWYVSEIMDTLTKNPEVWKKTILIMTYDENDGYFDHIPPFIPPNPTKKNSGKCSQGIDPRIEYTSLEQELAEGKKKNDARGAAMGLGYRVPLIIASPWTTGGHVCSQVFNHTSTLQFLETFVNQKFKANIREENISAWRRTICGNLTAAFLPADKRDDAGNLPFIQRDAYLTGIHQAQFRDVPNSFRNLGAYELSGAKARPWNLSDMPQQEPGIKPASAIPYEPYADLIANGNGVTLSLAAGNAFFGVQSAGIPFTVYHGPNIRSYAVVAGDRLTDDFEIGTNGYDIKINGPNGFYRHFNGPGVPDLAVELRYHTVNGRPTGNVSLALTNRSNAPTTVHIKDNAYNRPALVQALGVGGTETIVLPLVDSHNWYDLTVTVVSNPATSWKYAGRVETGKTGFTDPQMGHLT
ncbi:MAG TPA: phospholipase C, phosphocholine-specific [Parapedobacter sp.]|uniref:phosphocholine-specific phospholipase C n=1 Tax=Parapedobacter sp. TaxID=1958893 RepID=UPI002B7E4EAC|nr:phospholipase C, phosphocholine-specific [Parapedobacter sp.]HWK59544.1 phospholipase C, phosphocholine-specific [Parapedobacter sp.]